MNTVRFWTNGTSTVRSPNEIFITAFQVHRVGNKAPQHCACTNRTEVVCFQKQIIYSKLSSATKSDILNKI